LLLKFGHGRARQRFSHQIRDEEFFKKEPCTADLAGGDFAVARQSLERLRMRPKQSRSFNKIEWGGRRLRPRSVASKEVRRMRR